MPHIYWTARIYRSPPSVPSADFQKAVILRRYSKSTRALHPRNTGIGDRAPLLSADLQNYTTKATTQLSAFFISNTFSHISKETSIVISEYRCCIFVHCLRIVPEAFSFALALRTFDLLHKFLHFCSNYRVSKKKRITYWLGSRPKKSPWCLCTRK